LIEMEDRKKSSLEKKHQSKYSHQIWHL
jgi:hypothetical protein